MSTPSFRKKLRELLRRQRTLLARLGAAPPLLRGTFTRVHTRCGKPTCWCAQAAAGHPHVRLTWSQAGRLLTRKVPAEAIAQVLAWTANYRRFRADRRKLQQLHTDLAVLIGQHEDALRLRTRKPLAFLDTRPKMSPSAPTRRQKPATRRSAQPSLHASPKDVASE